MSTTVSNFPTTTDEDREEFDLDIRLVESGPVIAELLRSTSDNCGSTNQSACTTCQS